MSLFARLRALAEARGIEALAFLTGLGIWFVIPFIGSVPLAEPFLFAAGFWLCWRAFKSRAWPEMLSRTRLFRLLLALVGLMLFAYIISDIFNGTKQVDLFRGWARVSFLGLDILFMALLLADDWNHLRRLLWGFLAGACLFTLVNPNDQDIWKFGFAYPVSFVLPLLIADHRRKLLTLALGALGVLHIVLQARSLGTVCLLTAAMVWMSGLPRRMQRLGLVAGLVLAAGVVAYTYESSGVGEKSRGSTMERSAMLSFALDAFADSPAIGHGSWFTKSSRMERFWRERSDLEQRSTTGEPVEVVIHSQVLTALAEAGLLGGLFFLVQGALLLWGLYFTYRHRFPARACVMLLLLGGLWDLWMSPFSGFERIFIALSSALLIVLWDLRKLERAPASEAPVR